jgi:hypothetical protein
MRLQGQRATRARNAPHGVAFFAPALRNRRTEQGISGAKQGIGIRKPIREVSIADDNEGGVRRLPRALDPTSKKGDISATSRLSSGIGSGFEGEEAGGAATVTIPLAPLRKEDAPNEPGHSSPA